MGPTAYMYSLEDTENIDHYKLYTLSLLSFSHWAHYTLAKLDYSFFPRHLLSICMHLNPLRGCLSLENIHWCPLSLSPSSPSHSRIQLATWSFTRSPRNNLFPKALSWILSLLPTLCWGDLILYIMHLTTPLSGPSSCLVSDMCSESKCADATVSARRYSV